MPVIVIANPKGGVGKTHVTLNLIHHLNPSKIIDADKHLGLSDLNTLRANPFNILSNLTESQLSKELDTDELVVVDCGGYYSDSMRFAISQSDYVLIPSNDDATEQFALNRFNEILKEISDSVGETISAKVLLNKVHFARQKFDAIDKRIDSLSNLSRSKRVIQFSAEIPHASLEGNAVLNGPIAYKFQLLAKDILKEISENNHG